MFFRFVCVVVKDLRTYINTIDMGIFVLQVIEKKRGAGVFDRCAYQNIYIYCCVLQTKHLFLSFESREVEESVYLATFYLWASAYSVMRAKRGNEEVEGDREIGR